jgi:hypothetical protein
LHNRPAQRDLAIKRRGRADNPSLPTIAASIISPVDRWPHRDHLIAFARLRGREAAVTIVIRSFASFTEAGRLWPRADSFDGTVSLQGLSLQGKHAGGKEIHLSSLFEYLPVIQGPERCLQRHQQGRLRKKAKPPRSG